MGYADRPVPFFQVAAQRKATSGLSGRHKIFINAWLEAGFPCCRLPFQLALFHTEIGKALDLDSISPSWSAIAIGLMPEPPEQARLVDTRDERTEPFVQFHPFTHPEDGYVTGYLGYHPDARNPRLEQSTLGTWQNLRRREHAGRTQSTRRLSCEG